MIKVNNKNEFNLAVKYYQNKGYEGNPTYSKHIHYVGVNCNRNNIIYAWLDYEGCLTPLPKAIEVNNREEFYEAAKIFTDCGYKTNGLFYLSKHLSKYVVIDGASSINQSDGNYVVRYNIPIMKLKRKEKEMQKIEIKVGDIVRIADYSWAKLLINGVIHHDYTVIKDRYEAKWKVLETNGKYPVTYYPSQEAKYQNNDMICSQLDNPNCFLITNSLFAYYPEEPITVGDNKVQFNKDGSIKVGCTTVDANTLDKIINKLGYKKVN